MGSLLQRNTHKTPRDPNNRGAGDPAQVASAPFSPLPDGRREEGRKGGVCEIELVENSLLFDVFSSLIVETNDPF